MSTPDKQTSDHGRAARAVSLVATLLDQLPLGHPARDTARQIQRLFSLTTEDVRELLERVPGRSLAEKGAAIGIPRGSVWSMWKGRYIPGPEILEKIERAAGEKLDA
jgi:hypothetical protein